MREVTKAILPVKWDGILQVGDEEFESRLEYNLDAGLESEILNNESSEVD